MGLRIWNLEFGTWDLDLGISNVGPGMRGLEFGTMDFRNQNNGTWNPEHWTLELGIRNNGTRNLEQMNLGVGIW